MSKRVTRPFDEKEFLKIEFLLHNTKQSCHPSEFNGEYTGECVITKCPQKRELEHKTLQIFAKNISSCSTCFKYTASQAYQNKTGAIVIGKGEYVKAIDTKSKFTAADVMGIFAELHTVKRSKTIAKAKAMVEQLLKLKTYITIGDLVTIQKDLNEHSDLMRLFIIQDICTYFSAAKQKVAVRKMTFSKLVGLKQAIETGPWVLLFKSYTKNLQPNLKPITLKAYATIIDTLKVVVPPHIAVAITIYRLYMEDAEQYNHTIFRWSEHGFRLTRNRPDIDNIVKFLQAWAFTFIDLEKTLFSLKQDMNDAKTMFRFLLHCQERATIVRPKIRGTVVPFIPQELTSDQTRVANHIIHNCVTVVEGGPGVGKTSIISWAMTHFKRVLLCTLTGMMTKSLQARCGQRRECAHTIHSLIYAAFHPNGRTWLNEFDVLIVDEFSNVSTSLIAKLVVHLPNIVRIVFVGDYEQLRSINKGDPLGDMRRFFAPLTLTEILRVDPNLVDLATAPKMIVDGKFRDICFLDKGSLSVVTKRHHYSYKETLTDIWYQVCGNKDRFDLLSFHLICITNDARHSINKYSQEILIEMGILHPPRNATIKVGSHDLFPGVKITFSKNYNKDILYVCKGTNTQYKGMAVANGELGIVKTIGRIATGVFFLRLSDDKTVIISRKVEGAVDPNDVDLGYASTTTKVQGKEFAKVAYWHSTHPQHSWSRAHPYVALSRGKQKSWLVCLDMREFYSICAIKEPERKTVLSTIMYRYREHLLKHADLCVPAKGGLLKVGQLTLMPKSVTCLPIFETKPEEIDDSDE